MPEIPNVGTVVIVGFGLVLAILVALVLILSVQGKVFQSMDKSKVKIPERFKNHPIFSEICWKVDCTFNEDYRS